MVYLDVLLTKDGYFCVAPPWEVKEGDLVYLPDVLTGMPRLAEVIAVSTDKKDGKHIKQIEKYVGGTLPRITGKASVCPIEWEDDDSVSER